MIVPTEYDKRKDRLWDQEGEVREGVREGQPSREKPWRRPLRKTKRFVPFLGREEEGEEDDEETDSLSADSQTKASFTPIIPIMINDRATAKLTVKLE